ncbi:MAG: molybdopterin molybdenumtransferase MoeA [Dehalococcoidia bacterium]|nr:molybdopterin molybdenumtransferase MoeA [Dehalococcoidia bacterium]
MPELFTVVTPDEALKRLLSHLNAAIESENVKTNMALARVTSEEVIAESALPSFPRSTMDGYAVIAHDTYGASEGLPAYLNVVGEIPMGRSSDLKLKRGQVAKVHTGGMVIEGADAVVMVENTQQVDAKTIEVVRPVAPGENVIQIGDDVKTGEVFLTAGHWLRPQDIGGLMGLGITRLWVSRRPRVVIISTGDEVAAPEDKLTPGKIRDINTYTITCLALQAGAVPLSLGIIPDDYGALKAAAERGLEMGDIVVISAGSSVSTRDMTADVISSLGEPGVLVHGVSIKPGKPTILAVVDGKPVIGLPGNPVSAMVLFDHIVVPAIFRLMGCDKPPRRQSTQARLGHNVASIPGREDYVQVKLEERDGETWAIPVFGESNLIATLVKADGMAMIPLDKSGINQGDYVTVRLF